MPDLNGNIAEGAGYNFFLVKEDELLTPTIEFVLTGVSRQVVIDLCKEMGIPVRETDISVETGCLRKTLSLPRPACAPVRWRRWTIAPLPRARRRRRRATPQPSVGSSSVPATTTASVLIVVAMTATG